MQRDAGLGLRAMTGALRENHDLKACDVTPWSKTPPARERRVALASRGSFCRGCDQPHRLSGRDFREIPADARDLRTNHVPMSLERTGFPQNINVALPFDRLDRAAAAGTIGSIASTHYSCNGGSTSMGIGRP